MVTDEEYFMAHLQYIFVFKSIVMIEVTTLPGIYDYALCALDIGYPMFGEKRGITFGYLDHLQLEDNRLSGS